MNYLDHLSKDKILLPVLEAQQPLQLKQHKNICLKLCASIMSQQLSTKVADVIFKRFLALYNGVEPTPQQILQTPFETLRGIGLSNSKTTYVFNVAQFSMDNDVSDSTLLSMTNEEITHLLIQIKGVGKWTVEMLLMFTLGREDVFAVDDYGIQTAMKKLYQLDDGNKKAFKQKMIEIADKWTPYKTFACLHLWQWKDDAKK